MPHDLVRRGYGHMDGVPWIFTKCTTPGIPCCTEELTRYFHTRCEYNLLYFPLLTQSDPTDLLSYYG